MKDMFDNISKLIAAIIETEKVFASQSDWQIKYQLVFGNHTKTILPLMEDLGLSLEYYDPDGSYEDDVTAYMQAIIQLKDRLPRD